VLQRDQGVDMLVAALLIEGPVDSDAAELQHVQAGEPSRRQCRQDPFGGDANGIVERLGSFCGVERHRHDRARGELGGDVGFRPRKRQAAVETPAPDRAERIAFQSFRPRRQPDLLGMAEIESELRRRRVTPDRLDLETAQHDFLQPRRVIIPQPARRMRIAPEPPPYGAQAFALAKRPDAGGEEIKQDAERKQVAARIIAHPEQALGRHVGRGAVGQAEFLLQEIGQVVVVRHPEIDQNGFAAFAKHDAARLDVMMNDVLPVQIGERGRDLAAKHPDLFVRQRQRVEPVVQRLAGDALHRDIGLPREIAGAETARHMRPRQPRQDHLLHLEADDGGGILAFGRERHLHQERHVDAGITGAPQRRHAASVEALSDGETIDDRAGLDSRLCHRLAARRQAIGQP
jgi:hypothetical protein